MARFLTTAQSAAEIEFVIQQAKTAIHIVSPYIKLHERYRRRLVDAAGSGVEIHVVCRMSDLKDDQRALLTALPTLTLYDDPKVHGKVYANEQGAVVTSLNLYDSSEGNSEMGVWLDARDDREAYADALREIQSVIGHAAQVHPAPTKARRSPRSSAPSSAAKGLGRLLKKVAPAAQLPDAGHCIRCGAETAYDPAKPYCARCFRQWLRFKNPTYPDGRCHGCGKEDEKAFSMEKPECYACYKQHAKAAA